MIIVNTKGGLGNQMYQYALYLTLKNAGRDTKLCTEHYDWAASNSRNIIAVHGKKYIIEKIFETSAVKASPGEVRKYSTSGMDLVSRFLRRCGYVKKTHLREEYMDYPTLSQLLALDNVFLDGYWQRFDYYDSSESIIRESYKFAQPMTGKNKDIVNKIRNENSISIHVRRNDYLNLPLYVIQNREYYNKAMSFACKVLQKPVFYCFSDDIPWCRKNLISGECNIVYVDWNSGDDSYRDMQLMSQCKVNIISNSSFSMWAAWLNSKPDKTVIRPKHYYTDSFLDEQFFWPKKWLSF